MSASRKPALQGRFSAMSASMMTSRRPRLSILARVVAATVAVALLVDVASEMNAPAMDRSLAQKFWWKSRSRWTKRHQAFLQFWEGHQTEEALQPEHLKEARKVAFARFKEFETKQAEGRARKQAEDRARKRADERTARRSLSAQKVFSRVATTMTPANDVLAQMVTPAPVAKALHHDDPNPSPAAAFKAVADAECRGRATFNAGYGGCNTYAMGRVNHNLCAGDGALMACAECRACAGNTHDQAASTTRKQTRRAIERISLHDRADVLTMLGTRQSSKEGHLG